MKYSGLSLLALAGLMGTLVAPITQADPVYRRTEVTFHEPVEIPGMVLTPGTYVMKLLDPYTERNVVRFYNEQENHMYAMVFAVPDYRLTPADHTVITFEERAQNGPQAIKEWFPAGENWGEQFVYAPMHPVAAPQKQLEPRPTAALAPTSAPPSHPKAAEAPVTVARVEPKQAPVEIAQAQPAPAPVRQAAPVPTAAATPPVKELPKTASDLPATALVGGFLLLAGAVLRWRTA